MACRLIEQLQVTTVLTAELKMCKEISEFLCISGTFGQASYLPVPMKKTIIEPSAKMSVLSTIIISRYYIIIIDILYIRVLHLRHS